MCFFCGTEVKSPVYRNTTCPKCGKDLKICLNCRFYDSSAHWECRETISEPVRDKDRANFCEYFSLGPNKAKKESNNQKKARDKFNNLFGNDQ